MEGSKKEVEIDVIKKPRTNYSSTVLRRAVPNINIQQMKSITMAKLKVLTNLKFAQGDSMPRKVRTVEQIPKILTIISNDEGHLKLHSMNSNKTKDDQQAHHQLNVVDEREEEDSKPEKDMGSDFGSSDDSSIDGGGEEEEMRLYEQIIAQQQNRKPCGTTVDDLIDKEMIDLLRVCSQFKQPSDQGLLEKMVSFGPPTKTKVLVLDMDETLIHARFLNNPDQEKNDDGDFIVPIASSSSNETIKISVKMRPYLDNCLEHLAKFYEIAVFTAGEQSYADAVLDYLDEERKIIQHRLYRQHCVNTAEGIYVKDLRIISDRDLKDVILVDNSIVSFAFNLDNGVPISAFIRQQHDEELLYLVSYLEEIYSFPDTREHIQKTFKLREQMEKHCGSKV